MCQHFKCMMHVTATTIPNFISTVENISANNFLCLPKLISHVELKLLQRLISCKVTSINYLLKVLIKSIQ